MQCTLLIPHLLWPHSTAEAVAADLALPSLTKLLSRARAERYAAITTEAWLCQAFEVERQQDWPIAPLTAALDNAEVGSAYWLRADPVHIRVDRDRAVLVDNSLLDLSKDEAQALAAPLNQHFQDDAIEFHAAAPKRWYIKLERSPRLTTREASAVAGKDVRQNLPEGADALAWHAVFNEVQMLLHEHPVNEAREARGDPVINSVWFWGGGTRPAVAGRHFNAVWSDDAAALALGAAADAHTGAAPANAESWLTLASGLRQAHSHLIVLSELASAIAYHDAESWRTRVTALESDWFRPLIRALRENAITRLVVVAPGEDSCWRFEIARADLLKFWRAAKSLSSFG